VRNELLDLQTGVGVTEEKTDETLPDDEEVWPDLSPDKGLLPPESGLSYQDDFLPFAAGQGLACGTLMVEAPDSSTEAVWSELSLAGSGSLLDVFTEEAGARQLAGALAASLLLVPFWRQRRDDSRLNLEDKQQPVV